MATKKRADRVVEVVENKVGEKAEIKFSTEKKLFYCSTRCIGTQVQGATFDEVLKVVQERMTENGKLTWQPVIEVEYWPNHGVGSNAYQSVGFVRMRISRYWVAVRKNADPLRCWEWEATKVVKRLNWDTHGHYEETVVVDREKEADPFHCDADFSALPYFERSRSTLSYDARATTYFSYSDEVWTQLNSMVNVLNHIRDSVHRIIDSNFEAANVLAFVTVAAAITPTAPKEGEA